VRKLLVVAAVLAAAAGAGADGRSAPRDVGVLLVDGQTGARQRLTAARGSAAWSSDGRRIYVSGEARGDVRPRLPFAIFDARGPRIARRVLRTADVATGDVAVSPDGRRIAYQLPPRDPELLNTGDLAVAPLRDGRSRRLLSRTSGTPAWSPDGRRIAVVRLSASEARGDLDRQPARVVVVPLWRGRARVVAVGLAPIWLRDGRLLVWSGDDLVVVRPDGRGRRTVLRDVRAGEPSWEQSPDGGTLAVAAAGQGSPRYHLTLVDLAGGRAPRRIGDEQASDVAWAPDGGRLAIVVADRILVVDPSGPAPARELARIRRRQLDGLTWSPDGRRLAVTARVPARED